jgi:HK97 family phage prohead protease
MTSSSPHMRRLENRVARTAARLAEHAARTGATVADLTAGVRLPWYAIRNAADPAQAPAPGEPATVFIFDEIGGSFGVDAKTFAADLEEIDAPRINVRINSPGGSVFDAIAIHSALLHHPAKVRTYVDGLAASAASVIAMAADPYDDSTDSGGVVMMPGSQLMIHDASAVQDGNAAEMGKMQTFLDRQSANVADMYQRRAGGTSAEWRELMLAETWLFAREAVDAGLADHLEEAAAAVRDPDLAEAMARSFDLGQYRYAGRRDAPAPRTRRTAPTRRTGGGAVAVDRSSSDTERRTAARARGGEDQPSTATRRTAPAGISGARMAAFPAQLRAELVEHGGQQRYHLVGHASVVNTPYEMWDSFGPYMEVIDGDAFTGTLAAGPDVAFLVNHKGVTMARTTNDSLRLRMDSVGLAIEAWLNPKRQDVSDLVVAIQDRDVTEMSFAFMLPDGGGQWTPDMQTFRIKELDLDRGDVSAVNYGANPYTDVAARSREILADLDHLPAGAARAAVARLQQRGDIATIEAQLDEPASAPAPATTGRSLSHIEALLDI